MVGKRKADFQINQDNYLNNEDDVASTSGSEEGFELASQEELRKRKIKTHKRKRTSESTSGFSFSFTPSTTSLSPSTSSSLDASKGFSFTSSSLNGNGSSEANSFSFTFDKPKFQTDKFEFSFKPAETSNIENDSKEEKDSSQTNEAKSSFADSFLSAMSENKTTTGWDFSFNPTENKVDPSTWNFSSKAPSEFASEFGELKSEKKSWIDGENYTPQEKDKSVETVVQLSDKPVESGEENETNIHECPVKLFEYDNFSKEWKDRGVGSLRLNVKDDKARIIMRTKETRMVKLNARIYPNIPCKLQSDKSILIVLHNGADIALHNKNEVEAGKQENEAKTENNDQNESDTVKPSQFLLRMKEVDDAKKIYNAILKYSKNKDETA